MKKLDKKKPFGKVCGAGKARYEQDGLLFDANGDPLSAEGAVVESAPAKAAGRGKKSEPVKAANDVAAAEVDDQLAAQGLL